MEILTPSKEEFYTLMTAFFSHKPGCRFKIQCPGASMSPFIRHNSLLTVNPLLFSDRPKPGDIVLAAMHEHKRMLVHRIISQQDNRYLVKGDNNSACDGWFNRQDILGRIEAIEHKGKQATPVPWQNKLIAAASKAGFLNYLLLPAARRMKKFTIHV